MPLALLAKMRGGSLSAEPFSLETRALHVSTTNHPRLVPIEPAKLEPQQEGSYSLRLSATEYGSITLSGLVVDARLVAFTTSPGKQRTPERLEPRTIIVKKPGKPGEFINTPDNPTRVP